MKQISYKANCIKKSKTVKDLKLRNELANEHKILQRNLRKEIQLEKDIMKSSLKKIKNNLKFGKI